MFGKKKVQTGAAWNYDPKEFKEFKKIHKQVTKERKQQEKKQGK